ncbi:SAV_915 family protein [Actinacidiphila oryziradicis]|uniref:SseB protein N-terminal domain-containing protein n=1 Tax=Actinacidiphila oryziradicis TaxID=2571141 RepID=A0A4U0RYB1_9ACTN|nr:SAV_915 family protein [Actinacidiphila oryziradicis]TKA01382.1 hypothetical protein FCI23_40585 [Actinacidiphila oryziradicis]
MFQNPLAEDPEPSEPVPAGLLLVPVRPGPTGCAARFFRTPLGGRTAVGFTTEQRLTATLGDGQAWIKLSAPALRALATPLGVTTLTVDPQFTAPAPASAPTVRASAWHDWDAQSIGVLRVAGAAAVVSCLNLLIG